MNISVKKADLDKNPDLNSEVLRFCESTIEQEERTIYIPSGGNLLAVISLLRINNINYDLINYDLKDRQS